MFIYMSVCLYLYIFCKCIVISIPYLKKKELLIIVCAGIIINKLKVVCCVPVCICCKKMQTLFSNDVCMCALAPTYHRGSLCNRVICG